MSSIQVLAILVRISLSLGGLCDDQRAKPKAIANAAKTEYSDLLFMVMLHELYSSSCFIAISFDPVFVRVSSSNLEPVNQN